MVEDPRQRYDDLVLDGGERELDAEAFATHREMEAYRVGWAAGAVTLDDDGRCLLAYHEDDDQWMAPGGALKPGETLQEGLAREIREETGVAVDPVRPHAVNEWTVTHGEASASFCFVLFEADAETTTISDAPDPDGEITDADWFETPPADTLQREQVLGVLDRCRNGE